MNRKPIIGITADCEHDSKDLRTHGKLVLNWNYAEAVADAGGIPLIIPPMADMTVIASLIDGWLIPGGDDIDASLFGEENHPKVSLQDPHRFQGENRLFKAASSDLPILGICYGCQFLNVAQGGSLVQHLPDVPGTVEHTGGVVQEYAVTSNSKLRNIVGESQISGKSYHHQAVGRVAPSLKVVANASDGTIEALESSDRSWTIGVQWHPERTLDTAESASIFKSFIEAAAAYAKSRSAP